MMNPQVTPGMTVSPEKINLTLADGETRSAAMYPDGSYACPFCSGAVISPEGWQDNETNNARIYAAQGDAYTVQPYPHWQRETWEARTCGNPACMATMHATALEAARERTAAQKAERERQTRISRSIAASMRESKERENVLWDELSSKARAAGQCIPCLRSSYWQQRPKLVRHRDAANCPQARKYER